MPERTSLEIIAPTVEEALAQGLAQLGLSADAVSMEVLDFGLRGLFGLGGRQVRVRLTVNPPPGSMTAAPSSGPDTSARLTRDLQSAPDKPKSRPAEKKQAASEPAKMKPAKAEPETKVEHEPLLATTEAIVSKLLHHLGFEAQVCAHFDEASTEERRSIRVDVRGDDLSALIGRHAETLNAFQYLASLMVGKEAQQWVQLVVDVEGYRGRREQQLRQLARRMAEQVVKTGRRAALEPMTSNERRIIHIELRNHPTVTTESVGEEPYRKVTIVPKNS